MRVVFVGTEIPDYCIEFAGMMSDSCDALLCIPDRYRSPDRPKPNSKLEIAWLPWPRQRDLRNIFFTRNVSKIIRDWNPDIVHFLNESNVWNWILARALKPTPIITTVHDITYHPGDFSSRRVPRFFANALIRQGDAIIVHGEVLRAAAARLLPMSPAQIFVVPLNTPHLPSIPDFKSERQHTYANRNDGLFRILFFGRIYEYKGLRYLLEAMPLVRANVPNIQLIIAGEGDDISKYSAFAKDISYIKLLNHFIPRSEVAQLFVEADLLALPYIEASQSGPLMMAMAFGLPVVATEVGEISSVVRSTRMGLVVPPRDKIALADAITKVALDEGLRRQLSENAKQAMSSDYSREAISSRVLHIYEGLINQLTRVH